MLYKYLNENLNYIKWFWIFFSFTFSSQCELMSPVVTYHLGLLLQACLQIVTDII